MDPACSRERGAVLRSTLRVGGGPEGKKRRLAGCDRCYSMEFMARHEKTTCFAVGWRGGLAMPGSGFLGVEEIAECRRYFGCISYEALGRVVRAFVCPRLVGRKESRYFVCVYLCTLAAAQEATVASKPQHLAREGRGKTTRRATRTRPALKALASQITHPATFILSPSLSLLGHHSSGRGRKKRIRIPDLGVLEQPRPSASKDSFGA
jgi:hypothetical protein